MNELPESTSVKSHEIGKTQSISKLSMRAVFNNYEKGIIIINTSELMICVFMISLHQLLICQDVARKPLCPQIWCLWLIVWKFVRMSKIVMVKHVMQPYYWWEQQSAYLLLTSLRNAAKVSIRILNIRFGSLYFHMI